MIMAAPRLVAGGWPMVRGSRPCVVTVRFATGGMGSNDGEGLGLGVGVALGVATGDGVGEAVGGASPFEHAIRAIDVTATIAAARRVLMGTL